MTSAGICSVAARTRPMSIAEWVRQALDLSIRVSCTEAHEDRGGDLLRACWFIRRAPKPSPGRYGDGKWGGKRPRVWDGALDDGDE